MCLMYARLMCMVVCAVYKGVRSFVLCATVSDPVCVNMYRCVELLVGAADCS